MLMPTPQPARDRSLDIIRVTALMILIALVRATLAVGAWLDGRGILGVADALLPTIAVTGIVLYAAMLHLNNDLRDAGLPFLCTMAFLMVYKRA